MAIRNHISNQFKTTSSYYNALILKTYPALLISQMNSGSLPQRGAPGVPGLPLAFMVRFRIILLLIIFQRSQYTTSSSNLQRHELLVMENFTYIVRQVRNTNCPSSADDVFGPTVQGDCRQGFDFTLLFEQTVLSIPPAFLLIIFAPWRILRLSKASVKTQSSPIHSAKTVSHYL